MPILHLQDYSIFIGPIGSDLSQLIEAGGYSKVAILVDENTRRHCLPVLAKQIKAEYVMIEIEAGELHKSLASCQQIWATMMQERLDRHALLINLGGGVIGDMGGFCAATYMRGIDFIQIPTTLLAQVDASIGGKLGVDFNSIKNSIGVFSNPKAVFVDPVFLTTLPPGEIRSGFAEIFKHALIADAGLWQDLLEVSDWSSLDWPPILERSLRIKQQVVEKDPFEKGIRKALNFGHTIGHAVESFSLQTDRPLLHGEAVAIGIICESWLSNRAGTLPEQELTAIVALARKLYPHYDFREVHFPEILSYMKKDKKNREGVINFTFIPAIGQAVVNQTCEEELIKESLRYYLASA